MAPKFSNPYQRQFTQIPIPIVPGQSDGSYPTAALEAEIAAYSAPAPIMGNGNPYMDVQLDAPPVSQFGAPMSLGMEDPIRGNNPYSPIPGNSYGNAGNNTVRNVRNNNPGNLKVNGDQWQGAVGSDSGGKVASGSFVKFSSPEYGVRALTKDLTTKRNRGLNTIGKILPIYAPNGRENDTEAYIKAVEKSTGLGRNTKLTNADMHSLINAITKHEGGNSDYYNTEVIQRGMRMAGY